MTFARTKIQPPRSRAALVERGPLQQQVAQALATRSVVLFCAPAGYGKTTLLAAEANRWPPGSALAWVSADPGDDLRRLVECTLAALEPYDPPWRTAPEALLAVLGRGTDEAQHAVAAEIINTLDACEVPRGLVVFDDLHRVDDPAFFRFLDRVIERMSPRWTLALTSRTDPPLPLARLRAAGVLAEFRQLHLQFARDEARRLAAISGLGEAAADRLFDRTQGWPAGLRIGIGAVVAGTSAARATPDAALPATTERALRAVERPVFDYLVSEVVEQLPPDLTDFLLRASVLPELEAVRCAEVTGRADSELMLEEIERLGLFVDALDAPVRALRLHDLFRDALQQQLRRQHPALLSTLQRRAAASETDWVRRVALLLDAGDAAEAASIMYAHAPVLIATTGPASVEHLLARFPAEFTAGSPELAFLRGLASWTAWDFDAMHGSLERAATGFAAAGDDARAQLARAFLAHAQFALGSIETAAATVESLRSQALSTPAQVMALNAEIWLAIEQCRHAAVAPLLARMLGHLESVPQVNIWFHTTPPLRMPGLPGITPLLAQHAELMLRMAGEAPTPLRALGLLSSAWCALWRGGLDEARELVATARADARWSGQSGAVRAHLLALDAVIATIAGDAGAAIAAASDRLRVYPSGATAWHRHMVGVFVARIAACCEDAAELRRAWQRLEATRALPALAAVMASTAPTEAPIAAQLAWLEGRTDEAIAAWQAALAHEEAIDLIGQASESRVRLARAFVRRGDVREAARWLLPVFARADADGGAGGAMLAPQALQELAAVEWLDALPVHRQAQLRGWWMDVSAVRARRPPEPSFDGEAAGQPRHAVGTGADLTAREVEVLARIAAGDSNKLIARAFDLSLHTVKRHVANILGKLGVETRGQAAAWYRSRTR
ncbi:MAG: LuxR C-terminal-related transcriptional regulator [Steroidobacteraceae bacterium]|nr:LuxR C-terminal-related transcriptional regulator [Steroidobacteraceae bacterium]